MTDYSTPQPSPPPPGWLQSELLRQIATTIVRWALTSTGAALVALGWVGADTFQAWADAHTLELVGLALGALMAAWSVWNKIDLAGLIHHAANRIIPTRPHDDEISVEKVRQHYTQRQALDKAFRLDSGISRLFMIIFLAMALVGSQTACGFWFSSNPTDKFAQANKEVSGGVLEALRTIRELQKLRILSDAKAVPAAIAIGRGMDTHRAFLLELKTYLVVDADGRERLELPADAVGRLSRLLNSAIAVTLNVVNDPAITSLDSASRMQVSAILLAIAPALQGLVPLLAKLPKRNTPKATIRDVIETTQVSAELTAQIMQTVPDTLNQFAKSADVLAEIQLVAQLHGGNQ